MEHDYVDLGLPSGTKWAKCNYGAKTELDYGAYYNWDEAMKLLITLPTKEQIDELLEYTNCKWVENYRSSGINGRLFVSKINKNKIFIPAAGFCYNSNFDSVGYYGYVWSSSLDTFYHIGVYNLGFNSDYIGNYSSVRCNWFSVRGILY